MIRRTFDCFLTEHGDDGHRVENKHHPGDRVVHADVFAFDGEGADHANYSRGEEGQEQPAESRVENCDFDGKFIVGTR